MASITADREGRAARIHHVLRKFWGFDGLRPLQEEAISAALDARDSLVVLPTGGGKSLCYQVPPAIEQTTDVVVSPLISLMKDQVDGLRACGYSAAAIYSGLSPDAFREIHQELVSRRLRLLFVAPERLLTPGFLRTIAAANVRRFAIDEAHCISHWGHDFRPEYRRLAELKQRFPHASVHAFTATATERVRRDVEAQLGLRDARVLVGSFDRPNLVYRVVPRSDVNAQALQVVRRHKGQAVIVYCISRRDTESLTYSLRDEGVRAAHYHAGLDADERRRTQDAFAREEIDVVVATVAFGMGIDRSDVRCVLHAALPKSVEHYQQETGRAGRDGLAAECVLLYSPADAIKWESLIERSAANSECAPEITDAARAHVREMQHYASPGGCRHQRLVEYFGQTYEKDNCEACDVCLGEVEGVEDGTILAQKVLSCVARVEQRFGVAHVVDVLAGANTERVRQFRHNELSTYGLCSEIDKKTLKMRVYELLDAGLLSRAPGEFPVLVLNDESWAVMRGERKVMVRKIEERKVSRTRAERESWEGVDSGLFEELRTLRRTLAEERGVPAYVIFGDAVLRDMARMRPTTRDAFRAVPGVGPRKQKDFGAAFVEHISAYCREHGLTSVEPVEKGPARTPAPATDGSKVTASARRAFELFAGGASIEDVMESMQRARSTTLGYLSQYIAHERPESIEHWVDAETYARVAQAAETAGTRRLRVIFDQLDGQVPFDTIRLVTSHVGLIAEKPSASVGDERGA